MFSTERIHGNSKGILIIGKMKVPVDVFSIVRYHHGSKATYWGKRPRLHPIGGAGDLTNTLTNIRISAGGHSGQRPLACSKKAEQKVR